MTASRLDFVVVGNTPQARLIAGLLAGSHGKAVALQGESQSGYRLARGLDLSVGPVTRPETWALLRHLVPETHKLVARAAGRRTWSRIDPIFFADAPGGREAIGHIRQMASAFGHAAERVPSRDLGQDRDGIVLRDATLLHRPALERGLDRWLEKLGVRRLDEATPLRIAADGSATHAGTSEVEFAQTVLVGDAALARYLDNRDWPQLLFSESASTILTEPTPPIASPVMHQLDTRLTLLQPADRGISALGPGAIDAFTMGLRDLLGSERPFRQAGQSSYQRFVTRDGGPAVGRIGGTGLDVVAGFGMQGAFFAPALARWFCGAATSEEDRWLRDRLVDRTTSVVGEPGGPA